MQLRYGQRKPRKSTPAAENDARSAHELRGGLGGRETPEVDVVVAVERELGAHLLELPEEARVRSTRTPGTGNVGRQPPRASSWTHRTRRCLPVREVMR